MNSELELDDSDFLGSRKCRAEVRTSGLHPMPANGVRASDLTIFPGIWAGTRLGSSANTGCRERRDIISWRMSV